MISLSTIVAVEDFTAANGGTEVIPGRHMWSDEEIAGNYVSGDSESDPQFGDKLQGQSVSMEMPAGSCLVFAGTLLGYSIHPPFMGQVTASHPLKALAPDFVPPAYRK